MKPETLTAVFTFKPYKKRLIRAKFNLASGNLSQARQEAAALLPREFPDIMNAAHSLKRIKLEIV